MNSDSLRKLAEQATMNLGIEREDDGRWIAEWTNCPGAMAYGATRGEAVRKATDLLFEIEGEKFASHLQPAWKVDVIKRGDRFWLRVDHPVEGCAAFDAEETSVRGQVLAKFMEAAKAEPQAPSEREGKTSK